LEKIKVPKVLIAGLVMASVLGWTGWTKLKDAQHYYQIKQIFPSTARMVQVQDGDTFTIDNGMTLRLLGIDAPGRGEDGYEEAKIGLELLVKGKKLQLEYDTYQDDKFGRILAYVWISCMKNIAQFCHGDKALANEVMVKRGLAKHVVYTNRKKLKYEEYLKGK